MLVTDMKGENPIALATPAPCKSIGIYGKDPKTGKFLATSVARLCWESPDLDVWIAYLNGNQFVSFGTVHFVNGTAEFHNLDGVVTATADEEGRVKLSKGIDPIAKVVVEPEDKSPLLSRLKMAVPLLAIAVESLVAA